MPFSVLALAVAGGGDREGPRPEQGSALIERRGAVGIDSTADAAGPLVLICIAVPLDWRDRAVGRADATAMRHLSQAGSGGARG